MHPSGSINHAQDNVFYPRLALTKLHEFCSGNSFLSSDSYHSEARSNVCHNLPNKEQNNLHGHVLESTEVIRESVKRFYVDLTPAQESRLLRKANRYVNALKNQLKETLLTNKLFQNILIVKPFVLHQVVRCEAIGPRNRKECILLIDIHVESINQSPLPLCLSVHTRPLGPPTAARHPAVELDPPSPVSRPLPGVGLALRALLPLPPPSADGPSEVAWAGVTSAIATTSPGACAAVGPRPAAEAAFIAAAPAAATG